jgi:hypothetical protein
MNIRTFNHKSIRRTFLFLRVLQVSTYSETIVRHKQKKNEGKKHMYNKLLNKAIDTSIILCLNILYCYLLQPC